MTSQEFVIWMKGFMEACNDFTATPKQWDRIREVLYEVQDYNDNPGLDDDGWTDWYERDLQSGRDLPLSGSMSSPHLSVTFTTGSSAINTTTTVWNDSKGNWHYTNNQELENKKQQLND